MFTPIDFPLCLLSPARLSVSPKSSWIEHIPFALALVQMSRPRCIVELGVQYGDSFLAFCQAVKALGLETKCYGVDHWQGDGHAMSCGPAELARLREYHDYHYGGFSRLVQSAFDEAAANFPDGDVDLLHIDGYHTYEASRHDFETWRRTLSSRAVVLFHDTNVRERDFGVWRLWQELSASFPHFEFVHGHGLGVLAFGPEAPDAVLRLAELREPDIQKIRDFYFTLGRGLELAADVRSYENELVQTQNELSKTQERLSGCHNELVARENELALIKKSRVWRIRESLSAMPGLKQIFNRVGKIS